jgi:hypothetical protein
MLSESGSLFYRPKQKKLEGTFRFELYRCIAIELTESSLPLSSISRHRPAEFCQTGRRSLHASQRLGTVARFGVLDLVDLRAFHSDQGELTSYSVISCSSRCSLYAPLDSRSRAYETFAINSFNCASESKFSSKGTRIRAISFRYRRLSVQGKSPDIRSLSHKIDLRLSRRYRYFQNTGRLNRSGDAYRTIK